MNRAAAATIVPFLLLIRTASAFVPPGSIIYRSGSIINTLRAYQIRSFRPSTMSSRKRKFNNDDVDNKILLPLQSQNGGIPIGAVQLGAPYVQNFKDLIVQQLSTRDDGVYRGVETFTGPRNKTQQSHNLLLIHLSPVVATALDDGHPDLVNYLQTNHGVYLPGVRRSRNHRAAIRKKKNAMKELSSSSYAAPDISLDNNIALSCSEVSSADAPQDSTTTSSFTFGELFAGIGGFRLGLEAIGGKCVFANEMNPYAASIYRHHFTTTSAQTSSSSSSSDCCSLTEADILDIYAHEIPKDIDILTGGFPCQPFSSRGAQGGFNDERGQLYREIVRVLKGCHPKSFILENVVGLISMGEEEVGRQRARDEVGSVFSTILKAFESCGYDVSWRICNSRHYVAQHRERVFIVGIRNDLMVGKHGSKKWNWDWYEKILQGTSEDYNANPAVVRDIMEAPDSSAVLESEISPHQFSKLIDIHSKRNGIGYAYINPNQKAPTLISSYQRTGNHTSKFVLIEKDGTKRDIPRFLTPRECLRIMGFPEEFYAPSVNKDGNDATAHFYMGVGNAVVPIVVSSIGKELLRCLYP